MEFQDWIMNTVTIIGPTADLDRFRALVIEPARTSRIKALSIQRLNLERILSTPRNLDNRRNWRLDNWGTDRKPWGVIVRDQPDRWTLPIFFESACGFPEPAFKRFWDHRSSVASTARICRR